MKTEIDHEYTDFITCPHCGWIDEDSWEFDGEDGEEQTMECGKCDREFLVVMNISIKYSSKVKA